MRKRVVCTLDSGFERMCRHVRQRLERFVRRRQATGRSSVMKCVLFICSFRCDADAVLFHPSVRSLEMASSSAEGVVIWRPSRASYASRMVPVLLFDFLSAKLPPVYSPMILDNAPGDPYP